MKRTNLSAFLALWLGGTVLSASAAVDHLPGNLRAAIEQARSFELSTSTAAIPETVRRAFASEAQDETFAMAEPGANWQATDYIVDESLPRRRLQAVARSSEYLLLFYEQGGRGHSYHVSAFALNGEAARLVWRAIRPAKATTVDRLLKAIKSGEVDDDLRYIQ